jgi:hypothetical protein
MSADVMEAPLEPLDVYDVYEDYDDLLADIEDYE